MFAIIDTADDTQQALSKKLPMRFILPDGGVAQFDTVGQTEPWHAPRYTLVEVPDPEPVVEVPAKVSPRQARLALLEAELLEDVTALVASSPDAIKIGWEFATEVRRDDATLNAMADMLGFSDRLDDLFIRANQL